jgi:Tol biopolymer transport system component
LSFTPNRSWILTDGGEDISIYNPSLSIFQTLVSGTNLNYPALSPNGRTLAYVRGNFDIMMRDLQSGAEWILNSSASGGRDLQFSPDSNYLAYRSGTSYNPKLYLWRLEDTLEIASPSLYNEVDAFAWGPHGYGIAVISNDRLYYWEIGGTPDQIYSASLNIEYPCFSPTGDYIYFVSRGASGDVIMRSTISGSVTIVRSITAPGTIEAMGISSDGKTLLYALNAGSSNFSIKTYNVQTMTETTVASDLGQTIQISWF